MGDKENSAAAQIRNLMVVIGAGIMGAVLLIYMMVANFGPSGAYLLSNILLEPSLVEKISYEDFDPQSGKNTRYYFDRIEFMYFDQTAGRWDSLKLSDNTYQQIYRLLKSDKSISEVSSDLQTLFYSSKPASLALVVHAENRENTKVFQELQFEERGDYYRMLLRESDSSQNWIYFYHPKVLEHIKQIVKP